MIICIPVPAYDINVSMTLLGQNDIGTGIHMIIHYQLHYRQYLVAHLFDDLPSFISIFILVPLIFLRLERQGALKMAYIAYASADRGRLVTRPWRLFEESVGSL